MFQDSHNTDAHGSTFNDIGRDQVNTVNVGQIINTNNNGTMPQNTLVLKHTQCVAIFDLRPVGTTAPSSGCHESQYGHCLRMYGWHTSGGY